MNEFQGLILKVVEISLLMISIKYVWRMVKGK